MKGNKAKTPYSYNTELWFADYFWPFFSNYSYEEIASFVLDVLLESENPYITVEEIPQELLDSFGDCCKKHSLIDKNGCFVDPHKLVSYFCGDKEAK
jgi:hypothetical protein